MRAAHTRRSLAARAKSRVCVVGAVCVWWVRGKGWRGWWGGFEARRRTGVPRVDLELIREIAQLGEALEHEVDVGVGQVEPREGRVRAVSRVGAVSVEQVE